MTIDWTKPLELIDGTPVVLIGSPEQDTPGVRHEQGKRFTPEQYEGNGPFYHLFFWRDGTVDVKGGRSKVLIRNRVKPRAMLAADIGWPEPRSELDDAREIIGALLNTIYLKYGAVPTNITAVAKARDFLERTAK